MAKICLRGKILENDKTSFNRYQKYIDTWVQDGIYDPSIFHFSQKNNDDNYEKISQPTHSSSGSSS